jgi:hypothetical protein
MPIKRVKELNATRLREEIRALGMDARGPRSDLIDTLHRAGVYEINDTIAGRPEKYALSVNFPDHESVCIGAGAKVESSDAQKLIVCNAPRTEPLITGDFVEHKIQFNDCIQLKESNVSADMEGKEGELRRYKSILYMYRESDVHPGWYPLQFGPVLII